MPLAVPIGLALAILSATILFGSLYLRQNARKQITAQHAQILYALWLREKSDEDWIDTTEKASDQLPAVLQTARLRQLVNLLGTRLFDATGHCIFADANVSEKALSREDLGELHSLKPIAKLHASADLSEVSLAVRSGSPITGPLLEVSVPLHSPNKNQLVGVAQFLLDGAGVAAEFKTLDRSLLLHALLTFIAGGGLLVVVLGWSFHQLQRVNLLLNERTKSLLRANQELALAAKTSAVGAVTAHLIHGLRNPLSGLQSFVASRVGDLETGTDSDWRLAASSAQRMQSMISQIVSVLRDEGVSSEYEMSLDELRSVLDVKLRPLAREAAVELQMAVIVDCVLNNREANLISLILYNLVQNAIQATAKGKVVQVSFLGRGHLVVCQVRDQGEGVPESQRDLLFQPCRSQKAGGSGIGLAISKQLAKCINADLALAETSSNGSLFELTFEPSSRPSHSESSTGASIRLAGDSTSIQSETGK